MLMFDAIATGRVNDRNGTLEQMQLFSQDYHSLVPNTTVVTTRTVMEK
ncbi:MAG: hypothetical protein AB8B50_18170 [Pirellulaceae bacterium]